MHHIRDTVEGLTGAEHGTATVGFDANSTIGFASGAHISSTHRPRQHKRSISTAGGFARRGTLLSEYSTPARSAAELRSLLGDSRARVRAGATVSEARIPALKKSRSMPDLVTTAGPLALEQGKAGGPRVEVDILLESDTCVEGGFMQGAMEVRVRKQGSGEGALMLAGAKIRIIGFESIPHLDDRNVFYQFSAPLASISSETHRLYTSAPDEEGFCRARVGVHRIPFRMKLPGHMGQGAKGAFSYKTGIEVKYIAMASIKVKDVDSNTRSIAHFYRPVEIWPFFIPAVILATASSPITSSGVGSIFLGGSGKLTLTAMLHREAWIAGQRCLVKVVMDNQTKKTVKSVHFSLERVITIFRPSPELDARESVRFESDPDACQTTTIRKTVAEARLEMGSRGSKGVVSARGWWAGCAAGETSEVTHFIVIPPDALSIPRSKLIEVTYELRVGAGGSDAQVKLPLRIINFISLDPPVPLVDLQKFSASSSSVSTTEQEGSSPTRPTLAQRVVIPPGLPPPIRRDHIEPSRPLTVHFAQSASDSRPAPSPPIVGRGRTSDGRIIPLHRRATSEQPQTPPTRRPGPPAPASEANSPSRTTPNRPLQPARPVTLYPAVLRPGPAAHRARVVSTTAVDPRARLSDSSDSEHARAQVGARMLFGWEEQRGHRRAPSAPPGPLQVVAPHQFFAGVQASPQRTGVGPNMMSRSATSSPVKRPLRPTIGIPRAQSAFMAPSTTNARRHAVFLTPPRSSTPTGQWKHALGPARSPQRGNTEPPTRVANLAPGPARDGGSDGDEDKYGSETSHSSKSLYSQGRGSFSVPTLPRHGRQRATSRWSSSTSKEFGFQSSASDSDEDDKTPMNTIENRASRAIANRLSATEFHAPLLREKSSGSGASTRV
ncbi:hypothetical protein EXIGLDRAFT_730361 [Exidia glandulosa HHB12029]|uniref:Arrestin C-terminal-like domain-containing protein n=1 Tax=Exidia glandulosa HHB12029 TaxID=1314781 RepID=A0A165C6R7_EXIGL|nr:hypothetical protein EXIGLDRAFT_730361 [Exidia glandulosa HHB12029]